MWKDAVLLMLCCVMFVQMGLADAILSVLRIKFAPLSCPKCLTFWVTLLWQLIYRQHPVSAVAASFLLSYAALWLGLVYDWLATLYNKAYETITASAPGAHRPSSGTEDDSSSAGADGVRQVRKKNKVKAL